MSKIDNGGPAFPVTIDDGSTPTEVQYPGMSLRDWFAGQFLTGYSACPSDDMYASPEAVAEQAYKHADAMLAARVKEPSS